MKSLVTLAIAATLMLTQALAAFDPHRVVTAVDPAAETFSCRAAVGERSNVYKATTRTVFRVSGVRVKLRYLWNKGSLADLRVGDIVTVQYHLRGEERIADRVSIYPKR